MDNYFWKYMTGKGRRMHIQKGAFIYQHSDDPSEDFIYLLDEGICALTSMTMDGEENIHLYFHPCRLIAFNQHIITEKVNPASDIRFAIIAKTECTVYQIPLSTFRSLLRTDMEMCIRDSYRSYRSYPSHKVRLHDTAEQPGGRYPRSYVRSSGALRRRPGSEWCTSEHLLHSHTPVSYTHLDVYKRQYPIPASSAMNLRGLWRKFQKTIQRA